MKNVKLKGFIIVPITLSVMTATVCAKDVEKGFYVEGNVGQAKGYATQSQLRNDVLTLGDVGIISPNSQKRRAWKIGAGYRLDNNFSTALSYTDLGLIELGTSTANSAIRNIEGLSGKAISLTAAYNQPFNDWVNAHIKGGYSSLNIRENITTQGNGIDAGDNKDWVWGAGMSFDLNENISLMLDWERYEFENKVDLVSAGLRYTFGVVETRKAKPAPKVRSKPIVKTVPLVEKTATESIPAPVIKKEPIIESKTLDLNVYFDNNSSVLTKESKKILNAAGAKLTDSDVLKVSVSGFASAVGDYAYNQMLSNKRAIVVKEYISSRWSVSGDKIAVSASGETQASYIKNNGKDRKVTVKVISEK